ncbi:hypothetical protein [Duganella vulcania]|uniref:Uncharacterized protein n=1 Tax=Duganella vulcania TaxID=2692166 RepID=A0A845GN48_9BURK|nr:hypothetical protein [Duganella vulcania]MYM95983.1 hypothetical protein [Duganella vulcania]
MMRNFLALAPMLLSLLSAPALALDDTPTVAPHFQIKGEDSRQAGTRPSAAALASSAPRRAPVENEAARPEREPMNPRAVITTVLRPLPSAAGRLVEKPNWKLR